MEKGYAFLWDWLDTRSAYFWGVGVGLIIAWVTSGLAYLKTGQSPVLLELVLLEFAVSVIVMAVALITNTKRRK